MVRTLSAALLGLVMLGTPALAEGHTDTIVTHTTDQSYDDVVFGVENAIIDQGLVIDSVSHVGDMLERTRMDVGSDKVLFEGAKVFSFCSAKLSRKVMEEDWMNVGFCPYNIFVARPADGTETVVGYRSYPEGAMKEVEELLATITNSAIGMN